GGGGCSVFPEEELCSYDAVPDYQEDENRCDGIDNDCDGETDEVLYLGSLSLGDACAGLGLCEAPPSEEQGVVECGLDGEIRCSRDQGGSDFPADGVIDERAGGGATCDQLDNDCDGATDEDSPGWLPPGGTVGDEVAFGEPCDPPGPCGVGHVECSATGLLMCSTQLGGSESSEVAEESCNTIDDDCDGIVDEGFQWNGHQIGESCADVLACPSSEVVCQGGEAVCHNTAFDPPLTVTASLETCDGVDNDCDGTIDEEDGLKQGCPAEGVCANAEASGALCQLVTDADGESELLLVCSFVDLIGYEVGTELSCNGLDDDCDGALDEDMATAAGEPLGEPCMGVGSCADMPGVAACGEDGAVICKVAVESSEELCNGLDDDCDGLVDELPMAVPDDLGCKDIGVCAALETLATCVDGGWICAYDLEAGVEGYEDTEVSCDGLDNDCDGVADEGTGKEFVSEPVSLGSGQPPHRRRWLVAGSASGAPLLMGGVFTTAQAEADLGTGAALGDVWRYDHAQASWKVVAGQVESPTARYGHAMTSMDDGALVLVHGGYEYGANGFQLSDSLFVYQGADDTWFKVVQTADQGEPLPLRAGHTLTPIPDGSGGWQLILHGGKQGEDSGHTTRIGTLTQEEGQYALNWAALALSDGANPEPCRLDHGAVWDGVNERLVLIGGSDCGNDGLHQSISTLSLKEGPVWAPLVSQGVGPPQGVAGVAVVADDERMYVVGTTPDAAVANEEIQVGGVGKGETHVWSLDLESQEWTNLNNEWPSELEEVRSPAVWLGGGQLRVAGGSNDAGTDSWRFTWAYDLTDGAWGSAMPWAGPPPRVGATLVVRWDTGDTWLLGGVVSSKGKALQDAWMMEGQGEAWTVLESPLSAGETSTAKTLPALEGAA
ncbi:MAG: kelch repeat-containing protein, partial [Myxococcota bacterium]|nr:kelch repeat-containing protein [Myxococcota bacterium]